MSLDFKILTDEAETEDLLEEKTHQRIAEHLYELITDAETPGLTIGIEGKWGSGKSTVIGILNEKLKNLSDTFVFYIDTWAHEGDHLRRIFLEKFIDEIKNKINSKKDLEELDKIENSVCNRTITKTITNTAKINVLGTVLAILTIIALPIGIVFIDNSCTDVTLFGTEPNWLFIIGLGLSVLSVVAGALFYAYNKFKKKENPIFWTTETTDNTTDETTQESEKSSVEFDKFFKKILAFLEKRAYKNVVCVIDNLDRINEADALKIWSTLQIFIQGKNPIVQKSENEQKLWILVPYDETGLKKLWEKDGHNEENKKNIAKTFFDKSFQLRISVPQQVLSSWEEYAKSEIHASLKNFDEKNKNTVLNVLKWTRKDISDVPSPREIKTYINQIAFMYPLCKENSSLTALCYFVSLKYLDCKSTDEITKDLLDKKIPDVSMDLYAGKENLSQELCAIIFNVDKQKGMQLLLQSPIQKALNNNSDELKILRDTHNNAFYTVLEYVLRSINEPFIYVTVETLYEAFYQSDVRGFEILKSYVNIPSVKNNTLINFQTLSANALKIILSIKKDDDEFISIFNKNVSEKLPNEILNEKENGESVFDKLDSIIDELGDKCLLDIDYSKLGFGGFEKLLQHGKEKSVDVAKYVNNLTPIDKDIASRIDVSKNIPDIIPDVIRSVCKKVESLDKTLEKLKLTLTGSNIQIQNIMPCLSCLEALQIMKIIDDNIILFILNTSNFWHYIYVKKDSSYNICSYLLAKYTDSVNGFKINDPTRNLQVALNEVKQRFSTRNEELGKYLYKLSKDTVDYGFIWKLAKNHSYKTIGITIEEGILDKNKEFFKFNKPYKLLSDGMELVSEDKIADLVKCLIEFGDLIEASNSDTELLLLNNTKATLEILKQTKDKTFYSKLEEELKKVSNARWTNYFSKQDYIFNIICYLADSGLELDLANDYCESFKDYFVSKINTKGPLLSKYNELYKIMKKSFRDDFSVSITNKLFELDFEVEKSHNEFIKEILSTDILFTEKKTDFSEKIKLYIEQKNLNKLDFVISIIDAAKGKYIPDDHYSETLKIPIQNLPDDNIKQKLIKIFNVKIDEEK